MKEDSKQHGGDEKDDLLGSPKATSSGNKKWIAIIVVLLMVIAGLSYAFLATGGYIKGSTATPSVSISGNAVTGQAYNMTINANQKFSSIDVYFGDGSVTTVPYNGSNKVNVYHTYNVPGTGYVYYTVHFANGGVYQSSNSLAPIQVLPSSGYLSDQQSLGIISVNASASSTPTVTAQSTYTTGSYVNVALGYYNQPADKSYVVVGQTLELSSGKQIQLPYKWNSTSGQYTVSQAQSYYNATYNNNGLHVLDLITYTAQVNTTTGAYDPSSAYSSSTFLDIAVFKNANIMTSTNSGSTFINAESETGSYRSLDPQVEYDSVSQEIVNNVYLNLVGYNGSKTSSFVPILATNLPSVANGEINNNYANYSRTYTQGNGNQVTYNVALKPYENYTFHIRSNATWQDGTPVTAWDAMNSFARAMLFDGGTPDTPDWILAQYLLPGNYYHTNTFYNITQNITISNASNTITFHFQRPMSQSLVNEIMTGSTGAFVVNAAWLQAHGAGIPWTPKGFKNYENYSLAGNYNQYVANNVFADGPYKISYIVPSTEVVLTANPNFHSPGPWFPKPSIKTVQIEYIGEVSNIYLQMKSKIANQGGITGSDWYLVQSLETKGLAKVYTFNTISIFYYEFNANVNETLLTSLDAKAHVPQNLFASLHVRRAFAYAFNYSYFLNTQLGNAKYNTTFGSAYAGVLPNGMLGYQSIPQLNATTNGVPYYNMQYAQQQWNYFVNKSTYNQGAGSNQITWSSSEGKFLFGGSPLVIPLIVPTGNPTEVAAATTWGGYLQSIVNGASFPVIPLAFPVIISNHVTDKNPMPIYWLGWGPDYPFPSDYLGPQGLPDLGSHMQFNGFNSTLFTSLGLTSQVNNFTKMKQDYAAATASSDQAVQLANFHKENEMLVNETVYTYLYQNAAHWIVSPNVNGTNMIKYQENVMTSTDLWYNELSYNATS